MRYIYRLLFLVSTSMLILSACGTHTNENTQASTETSVVAEAPVEEVEETVSSVPSESRFKPVEVKAIPSAEQTAAAEETAEPENPQEEAAEETSDTVLSKNENASENAENEVVVLDQPAIEALANTTDLEIAEYSYIFTHGEDYIEIEVRETTDENQSHAALQGIYRYYPLTQEIFVRDYLTGDYFLYEDYQAMQNN